MDIRKDLSFRNEAYERYNNTGYNKYDYERNGILTKSIPKILFKGNTILVSFLQFLDMRIIMVFKYIDKLKSFKHISKMY